MFQSAKKHIDMQIRQSYGWLWVKSMSATEEMLPDNDDADASYPDADPDAT